MRIPLLYFPFVVSIISEAVVALRRISKYLLAEELRDQPEIGYGSEYAVEADGDFTWESAETEVSLAGTTTNSTGSAKTPPAGHVDEKEELPPSDSKGRGPFARKKRMEEAPILPTGAKAEQENRQADATVPVSKEDRQPFELKSIGLKVPHGSLVAIVGPVGSGKVFHICFCVISCLLAFLQSSILQALIGEMRKTKGHVRILTRSSVIFT
jgi:ATP-binding cassette subfamily C (CFTR/MRP) protein 1